MMPLTLASVVPGEPGICRRRFCDRRQRDRRQRYRECQGIPRSRIQGNGCKDNGLTP